MQNIAKKCTKKCAARAKLFFCQLDRSAPTARRSAHFFLIEFLFSRRSSRKKLANGFASNDHSSSILWSTTLSDNGQDAFFGFKYRYDRRGQDINPRGVALAGCYHVQDVSRSKLWRHLDFPIPCSHCCSLCSYQH